MSSARRHFVGWQGSQMHLRGETVTFGVEVATGEPVTYQWFRNSIPIPGATGPSHCITSAADADVAGYWVLVSTTTGNELSQVAHLVLSDVPILSLVRYTTGTVDVKVWWRPGGRVAIQDSTNLLNWRNRYTNLAPYIFQDSPAASTNCRFYRGWLLP